jgi:hypothetical protein
MNRTPTNFLRSGALALAIGLLCSGCGEFAYKRGANASDLDAAKQSCRTKTSGDAAYQQCMRDSGWVVTDMAKVGATDADPVIDIAPTPSDRPIENISTAPPPKAENYVRATPGQPPQPSVPAKAPDMMDTFKISSWWKAGSNADALAADTDACVAKLGEAQRPDSKTQLVTRGMLLCLREKGWSGLRAH